MIDSGSQPLNSNNGIVRNYMIINKTATTTTTKNPEIHTFLSKKSIRAFRFASSALKIQKFFITSGSTADENIS